MEHIKLKKISLKNHSTLTEQWLQNVIVDDVSLLGLGDDLIIRDKERRQPSGGRLDLLLQEADGTGRYEVEIQLGALDESHIIRTIEYWDVERRRYPQYEHTAVIIAEDITSRFLNVISLFNGAIPLIALQVSAYEQREGDSVKGISLKFTKVLDVVRLGLVDEDEEVAELTDRNYWETQRSSKEMLEVVDEVFQLANSFDQTLNLRYNKAYIGFGLNSRAFNFAIMQPRKNSMRLELRVSKEDVAEIINSASEEGFDLDIDYNSRLLRSRISLQPSDLDDFKNKEVLTQLLKKAYELRS